MRRINRDRSQNGINPAGKKQVHRVFAGTIEARDRQDADALAGEGRQKLLVPALVLAGYEGMYFRGEALELV